MSTTTALVDRARRGDRAAMEAILASVAPSIRRFALRMCRNTTDADDVLQDALFSITTHLDQFEGRSSLPSWAFTLTRSACSRLRRGKKNQPHAELDRLDGEPTPEADPEDRAASGELAGLVQRALDGLADEHREVLLLRDAEGLTAPEAAVVLGVSVDALKSRLHRARGALREALRPVLEGGRADTVGCPDVVRALSEKLEGDLDAAACAEIEKHVEACARCTRTCDAVRDALRACRATPSGPSPEVEAQVKAALGRWLARARAR